MRRTRVLLGLLVLLLAALGLVVAYAVAGQSPGPAIVIREPQKLLGETGSLDFTVEAPGGRLVSASAVLEQNGRELSLFRLADLTSATVTQETPDRIRIARPIGRRSVPGLAPGAARITVSAARSIFFGLRQAQAQAFRDIQIRFEPPRLTVISTKHYVNLGGSEMVVYRVTPPDVASGVRVGDLIYPGYPASGAGVRGDPSLHVAFFALSWDQDLNSPIAVFARDEAGNEATAQFDSRTFPRRFRRSRIAIDDGFLRRVVPAILAGSPGLGVTVDPGDALLPAFLRINRDLRRINADTLVSLASKTSSTVLWQGPFQPLGNAQVESAFADHRTYFYRSEEVDQQVHLGFDLASTARVPVAASNHGVVLYSGDLGIFGNCIILDHGMGVQSLYAHLSSMDIKVGDRVEKGAVMGRSGMTGLAGGDHLHFTILVNGHPVNAVEWWDPHWIEDRVTRKLREAGGVANGIGGVNR